MPIPSGFNVLTDAYITIELKFIPNGQSEIKRNCIGTEQSLVAAVIAAMVKQPELREVLIKAVKFYQANPEVNDIINKKF